MSSNGNQGPTSGELLPPRLLQRLRQIGGEAIGRAETSYPRALLRLPRPPAMLYLRGDRRLLTSEAVGVVGARGASFRALRLAEQLARVLAESGVTVVSGGAIGIDGAAHVAALAAGGNTVAVLGSGLDRPYPERHLELFEQIARQGALVTPFVPGAPPRRSHFPQRNALIAALSRAVVVVEAGLRSGALNTARWARDIGVPLAALPGSPGCQRTIAAGAVALRDPRQVLDLLAGRLPVPGSAAAPLGGDEGVLLELLAERSDSADGLAQRADLPVPRVAALLLRLELEGRVVREAFDRYRL